MVCILTYNIHCGIGTDGEYDLDRIASVICRSGADIACLQEVEVNSAELRARKWSQLHADDQPKALAKASGLVHSCFTGPLSASLEDDSCFRGEVLRRETSGRAAYGVATLSRFPVLAERSLIFERREALKSDSHIYMDKEEQPRGALAVLVDMSSEGEQPLWVINTHFSHKFASEEQRRQAKQLLNWVDTLREESMARGPVRPHFLLCGDLNSPSFLPFSSYSVIASDSRWRDLWIEGGGSCCQATFPANLCGGALGMRIDHIFALKLEKEAAPVCSQIRVLRDTASDVEASDHCAVLAKVEFEGPQE